MRTIVFAETTPALVARRKSVTRRDWNGTWPDGFHRGDLVAAYNRRREWGGRQIATLRLTADPTFEPMARMLDGDYEGEGFAYLHAHPALLPKTVSGKSVTWDDYGWEAFCRWRGGMYSMWVVRFAVVEVAPGVTPENCRQ